MKPKSVHATNLSKAEIDYAKALIRRAKRPRALPVCSTEERLILAILAADLSLRQAAKGRQGSAKRSAPAQRRQAHVNILLRHVVHKRYRTAPRSAATRMEIIRQLDEIGIEASDTQVRRDIDATLKLGPLPT